MRSKNQQQQDAMVNGHVRVGDLVRVTEDNWRKSISLGSIGIVTDVTFQVATVIIQEHGECWFALEDLEILNKNKEIESCS